MPNRARPARCRPRTYAASGSRATSLPKRNQQSQSRRRQRESRSEGISAPSLIIPPTLSCFPLPRRVPAGNGIRFDFACVTPGMPTTYRRFLLQKSVRLAPFAYKKKKKKNRWEIYTHNRWPHIAFWWIRRPARHSAARAGSLGHWMIIL